MNLSIYNLCVHLYCHFISELQYIYLYQKYALVLKLS